MKVPSRILGLIAAAAATPVIAGCANESSDPRPNKTDQTIQTESSSNKEASNKEASEPQPPPPSPSTEAVPPTDPAPPDDVAPPDPASEPQEPPAPGDIAPAAEDAPLKGVRPMGALPAQPLGGGSVPPQGGSSRQEPCPACGLG